MLTICEVVVTLYNDIPNAPICVHLLIIWLQMLSFLLSDEIVRVIMYLVLTNDNIAQSGNIFFNIRMFYICVYMLVGVFK